MGHAAEGNDAVREDGLPPSLRRALQARPVARTGKPVRAAGVSQEQAELPASARMLLAQEYEQWMFAGLGLERVRLADVAADFSDGVFRLRNRESGQLYLFRPCGDLAELGSPAEEIGGEAGRSLCEVFHFCSCLQSDGDAPCAIPPTDANLEAWAEQARGVQATPAPAAARPAPGMVAQAAVAPLPLPPAVAAARAEAVRTAILHEENEWVAALAADWLENPDLPIPMPNPELDGNEAWPIIPPDEDSPWYAVPDVAECQATREKPMRRQVARQTKTDPRHGFMHKRPAWRRFSARLITLARRIKRFVWRVHRPDSSDLWQLMKPAAWSSGVEALPQRMQAREGSDRK